MIERRSKIPGRRWIIGTGLLLGLLLGAILLSPAFTVSRRPSIPHGESVDSAGKIQKSAEAGHIHMSLDQQKAVGIGVEPVRLEQSTILIKVPGRITPDESKYAFITPRAAGIVRSVAVHIGQEVKAGDLLATIESPEVGLARLDLLGKLQSLDVAIAQARWQETIHHNTIELIERLKQGDSPDQIHERFQNRPVGDNRERLMTAYTSYRLAKATLARKSDLFNQEVIRGQQLEEVKAKYEADLASYQSLMDQMGYETNLSSVRAKQALRQAETSVLVARERLQILGINPDDDEFIPKTIRPPATADALSPGEIEVGRPGSKAASTVHQDDPRSPASIGLTNDWKMLPNQPASIYKLTAPFSGVILDRDQIIPGVAVDVTHRIFTLANLEHVWIEANVNISSLEFLRDSRDADVRFTTEAYANREFRGQVLYKGDLVTEKTQSVNLLARAENPDRLLKPGMYIEVTLSLKSKDVSPSVPSSALVTDKDRTFVFVRTAPEQFERREVKTPGPVGERAAIQSGLKAGEVVVNSGAFKLKAEAIRMASS